MQNFIDIGGFKGAVARDALRKSYFVHVFEPNPNMKRYLKPLEAVANINYAAAWDKDGRAKLYLMSRPDSDLDEDGVSLESEKTNVDIKRFIMVPTINIGKYLKDLDEDIDILKINAEGAEYTIIESILNEFDYKRIKRWMVEDHADFFHSQEWLNKRNKILDRLISLNITLEEWNLVTNPLR